MMMGAVSTPAATSSSRTAATTSGALGARGHPGRAMRGPVAAGAAAAPSPSAPGTAVFAEAPACSWQVGRAFFGTNELVFLAAAPGECAAAAASRYPEAPRLQLNFWPPMMARSAGGGMGRCVVKSLQNEGPGALLGDHAQAMSCELRRTYDDDVRT